jgi:hypothetical protein
MDEKLILKTQDKPTIFNKDMLLYGLTASIFAGPAGLVIGGLAGGYIGKKNIEKANSEGKEVGTPSSFNKKMVIGGLLSRGVAGLVLAGMGVAAPGLLIGTGIVAAGAVIGGKIGKKEQQQEFDQALQQKISLEAGKNTQQNNRSQNAAPEPSQQLSSPQISWAEKVSQNRPNNIEHSR